MVTIKTKVDDKTYRKLVKMRTDAGLPSVPALFLDRLGMLTDEKEANEIVDQALRRATEKPSGTIFKLSDLFGTRVWTRLSKGARLRAGKLFNAKVSLATDGIRAVKKSSSGHQYYEVA